MTRNALEQFVEGVRSVWGPLSSELVLACRIQLERLLQASPTEDWLAAVHRAAPANDELYRDPDHGFILLAHTEQAGLYRPPHDHGRGWVIYAIQSGEIEMGTYAHVEYAAGRARLVKRDTTIVRPGHVQVYLPGDIHDTRCLTGSALLFRFTERDLKVEDKRDHRVKRYVQKDGAWTVGTP